MKEKLTRVLFLLESLFTHIIINAFLVDEKFEDEKMGAIRRKLHKSETKLADIVTKLSGSMYFAYLHIAWFLLWVIFSKRIGDPFPYGLLTMLVSLEAIFLSTFILVSQNRQADLAQERAQEDDKEEEEQHEDIQESFEDLQDEFDDLQKDLEDIKKLVEKIETRRSVEKSHNPT